MYNVYSIFIKVNCKHIILYVINTLNQLSFTWISQVILFLGVFFWGGGGIIQVTIAKIFECQKFI